MEEVTVVELLQSSPTLCDPMNCCLPGSFCPWDFPGKNTEVGCHLLLQRIFSTQGLNWPFLHWQAESLPWSHLGSPKDDNPGAKTVSLGQHPGQRSADSTPAGVSVAIGVMVVVMVQVGRCSRCAMTSPRWLAPPTCTLVNPMPLCP